MRNRVDGDGAEADFGTMADFEQPPASGPTLFTERLCLRPFEMEDAPTVERLAGDRAVAATTLNIPHPYPPGTAADWILSRAAVWSNGSGLSLAMVDRSTGLLIGAISLTVVPEHRRAELGYWVGRSWWGHGYATEATRGLIDWAFANWPLDRLEARHFHNNPASGRVLAKAGLTLEGWHQSALRKWGQPMDVAVWAILRKNWSRPSVHREQSATE